MTIIIYTGLCLGYGQGVSTLLCGMFSVGRLPGMSLYPWALKEKLIFKNHKYGHLYTSHRSYFKF